MRRPSSASAIGPSSRRSTTARSCSSVAPAAPSSSPTSGCEAAGCSEGGAGRHEAPRNRRRHWFPAAGAFFLQSRRWRPEPRRLSASWVRARERNGDSSCRSSGGSPRGRACSEAPPSCVTPRAHQARRTTKIAEFSQRDPIHPLAAAPIASILWSPATGEGDNVQVGRCAGAGRCHEPAGLG
jgi:hypothetical protein